MFKAQLWNRLASHPGSAWLDPRPAAVPDLPAGTRLLWCAAGLRAPAGALVGVLAAEAGPRGWVPLERTDAAAPDLHPGDQAVFASRTGRELDLWTWIGRLRALHGWAGLARPPLVLTADDGNPLAAWARAEGCPLVPLGPGRGRFEAFGPAMALLLACLGRDPQAFLEGGREVAGAAPGGLGHWSARVWGLVETLHEGFLAGIQTWAVCPWGARLEPLAGWCAELASGCLNHAVGEGRRRGLTFAHAAGARAGRALMERGLAGPRTLGVIQLTAAPDGPRERLRLPAGCPYPGLGTCSGAQVLAAQAQAASEALEAAGVPVVHWQLEGLGERALGEFLMAWQLVVALTAYGLELDPFAAPAGADADRRALGRLGLEPI